jgi:hypothetical protein
MATSNQDRKIVTGIKFIGQEILDDNGLVKDSQGKISFNSTTVGGLSGITFATNSNSYYVVSDDRSQPRFYTLTINLSDGILNDKDVNLTGVTNLTGISSTPDTEGITLSSDGSFFIVSEGDADSTPVINPFINKFSPSGKQLMELAVPSKFLPDGKQTQGIRDNLAFESVTVTPDGKYLFAATENALVQDGGKATTDKGSPLRILKYDLTGNIPQIVGEFLYVTETLPSGVNGKTPDTNGLVELLAVDNSGTLLALERSLTDEKGFTSKLFQFNTQDLINVSNTTQLNTNQFNSNTKKLLFDLSTLTNSTTTLASTFKSSLGVTVAEVESKLGTAQTQSLTSTPGLTIATLENIPAFQTLKSQLQSSLQSILGITVQDIESRLGVSFDTLKSQIGIPLTVLESQLGLSLTASQKSALGTNLITLQTLTSTAVPLDTISTQLGIPLNKLDTELGNIGLDNFEGMTWGSVLPNGKRSLILVSDNNLTPFGVQTNKFLAFELDISNSATAFINNPEVNSQGVATLNGENDRVNLKISLLNDNNPTQSYEIGVFIVDNDEGAVNGIKPGATGYLQAVLPNSQVLFSAIANRPNGFNLGNIDRILAAPGKRLGFYRINNGTSDDIQRDIQLGRNPNSNVLFSTLDTSQLSFENGSFILKWKGNNILDNLGVKIEVTSDLVPIGTGVQGGNQRELIDTREITGQVSINVSVYREAAFNNLVGFYSIDDLTGGIGALNPSNPNLDRQAYVQAALARRVTGLPLLGANNQANATFAGSLTGNNLYAPFIIVNGTLEQLLDSNGNNNPQIYFPFLGANSDGKDHIRLLGNNIFGFEDLPGGGDNDYNDMIVKISLTTSV